MNPKRSKKSEGNGFARNRVFEVAAEVFHRKGYDNTSMSDVATAAGLTKAGLYHHVSSKESLLYTILDSGLDLTESYVIKPLEKISDPLQRLSTMIDLHLRLVLEERNLEVTGLLHALLKPGVLVTIDLATQTLSIEGGPTVTFPIDSFSKTCILEGLDEIGYILKHEAAISAYEQPKS